LRVSAMTVLSVTGPPRYVRRTTPLPYRGLAYFSYLYYMKYLQKILGAGPAG
jgi:hypothetical protein